jgi:hypothetical protein
MGRFAHLHLVNHGAKPGFLGIFMSIISGRQSFLKTTNRTLGDPEGPEIL